MHRSAVRLAPPAVALSAIALPLLLFLLGAAGCAGGAAPTTGASDTADDGAGNDPAGATLDSISEADNGKVITLGVDQVLALQLDGTPSSGYSWQVDSFDAKVLAAADTDLKADFTVDLGGSDTQTLLFVGVDAGETDLALSYRRPWEKGVAADRSFAVHVKVLGAYRGEFHAAPVPVSEDAFASATSALTASAALPAHYNACESGGCTPVKDQSRCGGCWAFATVGVVESAVRMKDGVTEDLSEQYLLSCNSEGWGCGGGAAAFPYFINKFVSGETGAGAVFESDFRYAASDAACNPPHAHHERLLSSTRVGSTAIEVLKQAIYDHGPIFVSVCADGAFTSYRGGVFTGSNCTSPNHAVILTGWDDNAGSGGYWFMKNSWGTAWGESGYMRIKWGVNAIGGNAYVVAYGGSSSSGGTTTPTCSDGLKNGTETDIDCGGSCATRCATGRACALNSDCASGRCSTNRICSTPTSPAPATCTDGIKNGTETDVDCGGSCAITCSSGKACALNSDCASGRCSNRVCAAPSGTGGDVTPPTVSIASPADGAHFPANSAIQISVKASDDVGVSRVALHWSYLNQTFTCGSTSGGTQSSVRCSHVGNTYTWSILVGSGDRTFSATASDAAGNQATTPARTITFR